MAARTLHLLSVVFLPGPSRSVISPSAPSFFTVSHSPWLMRQMVMPFSPGPHSGRSPDARQQPGIGQPNGHRHCEGPLRLLATEA